jgi:hypothetical protein
MIRRFVPPTLVQLAGLCAVVMLAGTARAAEPGTDPKTDELARIVKLLDQVEQRMSRMDAKLDAVVDMGREMKQLRDDVTRLQRDVTDLKRSGNSTSYYPGQTPPLNPTIAAAPPAQVGRVRLVNTYIGDMTTTVNGMTYTVPAGQTLDVPVPAGQLTYQVWQIGQPMKVTTLSPNQMLTLTLFPV